ncbi:MULTISPECIES: hypothetical protein [Bacillus]|uniref:Uncharacterized protein n=1 Tax=Bacillus mycoides (strain KBAB4) TaxID=315730 RepID=A9VS49_BACMK|nr:MULTISPECIES: hypothetical protein [Bacillus]ABY44749.1 hypothetical protein BcerKBAB4_3578 [Bacillus mycoides KBAB4]MBK5471445.1 hypothetical protein [Bacillus sp. TH19]PEK87074.1 hypothetical protein CN600_28715 [Bacillus mycoides]QWG83345.1 hypothetical protein EXW61_07395 [Bacillus mycoides]
MENNNVQGMPLLAGEGSPFMGRLVDAERSGNGVLVQIPFDMLDYAGIQEKEKVEVWGMSDGTLSIRMATKCQMCNRGARLFELQIGSNVKKVCAEDYYKLTGEQPQITLTENKPEQP